MIKINNNLYNYSYFPNKEIKFPEIDFVDLYTKNEITIDWIYESAEEIFLLQMLKKRLDDLFNNKKDIVLISNFLPYGQQDRKTGETLFSFKYFAEIINEMNFTAVEFVDPHSIVMECAIKNAKVSYLPEQYWFDLYFYPDNGACKKYSEIYNKPYRFGNKKRNLDTGEIINYEIIGEPEDFRNKEILIVDDICMGGRTFKEAAKALQKFEPKSISLQITHFMPQSKDFLNTFKDYGIKKIYTSMNGISEITLKNVKGSINESICLI